MDTAVADQAGKTEFAKRNPTLEKLIPDFIENAVDAILPDALEAVLDTKARHAAREWARLGHGCLCVARGARAALVTPKNGREGVTASRAHALREGAGRRAQAGAPPAGRSRPRPTREVR